MPDLYYNDRVIIQTWLAGLFDTPIQLEQGKSIVTVDEFPVQGMDAAGISGPMLRIDGKAGLGYRDGHVVGWTTGNTHSAGFNMATFRAWKYAIYCHVHALTHGPETPLIEDLRHFNDTDTTRKFVLVTPLVLLAWRAGEKATLIREGKPWRV